MKLARTTLEGRVVAVLVENDLARALDTPWATTCQDPLLELIRSGTDLGRLSASGPEIPLAEVTLLAPLAHPGKIIAIGLNYADHTAETGLAGPREPLTFAKYPSSVIGPGETIVVPTRVTRKVDWEAELAVVMGAVCGPSRPGTLADVAAYSVANDVSARDLQFNDGQWTRGKSVDTFCPLGPVLVTADSLDVSDLRIWATVNGRSMQDASTADMIFDVPTLLTFLTQTITLEPGDVILTGTPAGVGPLVAGNAVTVLVEGVGPLTNPVVARA